MKYLLLALVLGGCECKVSTTCTQGTCAPMPIDKPKEPVEIPRGLLPGVHAPGQSGLWGAW